MKVLMNEKTKDFINQKTTDNTITIMLVNTGSGWVPNFQPSVKMGKPSNEKDFKLVKVGDISVYIRTDLRFKGDVAEVSLARFLWTKYLNVSGLAL